MKNITLITISFLFSLSAHADWKDTLGLRFEIGLSDQPGWKVELGESQFGVEDKATFELAKDYKLGKCQLRQGARLTFNYQSFGQVDNLLEPRMANMTAEYGAPMFTITGCSSGLKSITRAQFVEMFSEVSPMYKTRHEHTEKDFEKALSLREQSALVLNVGDVAWLEAMSEVHPESPRISVIGKDASGQVHRTQCAFAGGAVKIKKMPVAGSGENFELEVTQTPDWVYREKTSEECKVGSNIELTESQMKRWFNYRFEVAAPLEKGGKCYSESAYGSLFRCELHRDKGRKLASFCPDLLSQEPDFRAKDWEEKKAYNEASNYGLAQKFPAIPALAYKYDLSLSAAKNCLDERGDTEKVYQDCVKRLVVACPKPKKNAVDSEEAKRMEYFMNPKKHEDFIKGVIENQGMPKDSAPVTVPATLD